MRREYINTPEGQIHYRTEGSGKPILLLHQVGASSDQFSELIPFLSKYYRVIAVDLLGYGNSDMPSQEYRVEDYALNIIHVLDALNIKKTDIVGSRLGGSIAVEIAAVYPERINKLIIFECVYAEPEVREERVKLYFKKRTESRELKEDGSHLTDIWNEFLSQPYQNLEMRQRSLVDYIKVDLGRRVEDGHIALFLYDIESKLPAIKSPTLVLNSPTDRWLKRVEAVKSLIPRCWTKIIKGAGQMPTWEKPRECAISILEFLEDPNK